MKSKVYYSDVSAKGPEDSFQTKVERLFDACGATSVIKKKDLTAIKVHFGEMGNNTFLRPTLVQPIVKKVAALGAKPFLTDSNTLYTGSRSDAVEHIWCAFRHGWLPPVVDAPVIIADGLTGREQVEVKLPAGFILKSAKYGAAAAHADSMIVVSHVKGHLMAGLGGAIKNTGMGLASRAGKQAMHSDAKASISEKRCISCGRCIAVCPAGAIELQKGKGAAVDTSKCMGCGECVTACREGAVKIRWDSSSDIFQKKMVEYTYAVLKDKKGRCAFFNFLLDITPGCDCFGWSDTPIVPNIGILASLDPVAIDAASAYLINSMPANMNSRIKKAVKGGEDKLGEANNVKWEIQLEYAEKTGLGTRDFEIVKC
ncbi:MAG: DUF362 domain-containing protein [Thermoplasmata archaeon]